MGVTGLPSDDAVLDSVLEADGADPDAVDRVTIGFNAVASPGSRAPRCGNRLLERGGRRAAGAAAFPTGAFRVDEYGAPRYPELVLRHLP